MERRGGKRGSAFGMNSRLARREMTLRLGCRYYPDSICRTAGEVTRMSGGVGGGRPRGPSLSRLGPSSTRVERRYAPAEATVVIGKITSEFLIRGGKSCRLT